MSEGITAENADALLQKQLVQHRWVLGLNLCEGKCKIRVLQVANIGQASLFRRYRANYEPDFDPIDGSQERVSAFLDHREADVMRRIFSKFNWRAPTLFLAYLGEIGR